MTQRIFIFTDSKVKNVVPIEKMISEVCNLPYIDNQVHMFAIGDKVNMKFI